MKPRTLKNKIFSSFFAIVLILGLCISVLGFYVIKTGIIERAQDQVDHNLASARSVYLDQADSIRTAFELASFSDDNKQITEAFDLDYYTKVDYSEAVAHKSSIVRQASDGKPNGGTRIIFAEELSVLGEGLAVKAEMDVISTPKAKPTSRQTLVDAMAIEYAKPIYDADGKVVSVVYAGKIVNRDFSMVDKIRDLAFENKMYDDKPIGTVTIFQDDTRIATNVLNEQGVRAIGTRVSESVYDQVVGRGESWFDRAFVVTDWYLTAYEPIRDIDGEIVGILYVGTLEKPFNDMIAKFLMVFLLILLFMIALGGAASYLLAFSISRPVTNVLDATEKLSHGELGFKASTDGSIVELNMLARSFNQMSAKLNERDISLKESNEKLAESNQSYVDLIGFVAHELKGLLFSAILNAYSLRDGYLGMINFKQQRAVNSITRNLDYLSATVKKFLNLSSIEKGELQINETEFLVNKDLFGVSVETFSNMVIQKKMVVTNKIDPALKVKADCDMMMIVANNLVNNAIKYGVEEGRIELNSSVDGDMVTVEVYNDGRPITDEAKEKLFKKFSRLDVPEKKKVKGTGLGLFITKEIIEAHGGKIYVEAKDEGNSFIFQIERGI